MGAAKVRGLAVVGLGMALPPHAQALAELEDVFRVVGAWSPSAARRARVASERGWPEAGDLDALIADPGIDAALILAPPHVHADLAARFLDAGKDVLVEKPLDVSLAKAEAMVHHARERGRTLGVVLQHRHRPGTLALAALLAEGRLGTVEAASCVVPWWRDQAYYDTPGRGTRARDGGGVLITQAIHVLDVFRAVTGGIGRVAALARTTAVHRMECEDVVGAALELRTGGIGSLFATTAAYPGHGEEVRLVCTEGVATLGGGALVVDWLDGSRDVVGETSASGGGADPMAFAHEAHKAVHVDFARAIDEGREPLTSGLEALRTQHFIEALLDSAGAGGWVAVPEV